MLSEASPREGDHPWYRPRREAEDVFLAAGAAVVHLPDFFGPDVHTSSVQMALDDAVAGRPVRYDSEKLRKLLGPPQPTPFEVSIPATLDWLRQGR